MPILQLKKFKVKGSIFVKNGDTSLLRGEEKHNAEKANDKRRIIY